MTLASLGFVVVLVPGPCTAFDGDQMPTPPGDADAQGVTYLSTTDAALVCARVVECPTLAGSLVVSTGIPLAADFPACMQWVSGPVPAGRLGFASQQSVLREIAAATSCAEALGRLPREILAGNDPRCASDAGAGSRCLDSTTSLDCATRVRARCDDGRLFGPGATCRDGTCSTGACGAPALVWCTGDRLDLCVPTDAGRQAGHWDCTALGLKCETSGAASMCSTPGGDQPCKSFRPGDTACSDDKLKAKVCVAAVGTHWGIVDCTQLGAGASCEALASGGVACAPPRAECALESAGSCDRSTISLCVGGRRTSFDCASIGRTCDPARRACVQP